MQELFAALPSLMFMSPGKSHESQNKLKFLPSREDQAAPVAAHEVPIHQT